MGYLNDYQVRFLDAAGALLEETDLAAENLTIATECAREVSTEMHAADFFITLLPPKLSYP